MLIFLCLQLTTAQTTNEINTILDDPKSVALISSSKSSSSRVIKPDNKNSLLQNLITEELITKLAQHLVAYTRGLVKFGLQRVCCQFPNQCQELFMYNKRSLLSADKLVAMIRSSPSNSHERMTLDWLVEYLTLPHSTITYLSSGSYITWTGVWILDWTLDCGLDSGLRVE